MTAMFSQTAEYALRIVVYLASLDGEAPATIAEIATATRTPPGYLAKVLRQLARANLIHSQRGPHGGSVLARDAGHITVYDVVQAVDPIQRITTCPLGIRAHGVKLCPLHLRLDSAIAMVERAFKDSPISELIVPRRGGSRALCDEPAIAKRTKRTRSLPVL
ncbi:MAG TPA: Rrf2 family transcriptional regulator [Tepidisphaeraceae bacterium]|nr:Rrf2 family transcriptional regulator [Tepidisphaeraceae bacterium]